MTPKSVLTSSVYITYTHQHRPSPPHAQSITYQYQYSPVHHTSITFTDAQTITQLSQYSSLQHTSHTQSITRPVRHPPNPVLTSPEHIKHYTSPSLASTHVSSQSILKHPPPYTRRTTQFQRTHIWRWGDSSVS